MSGSSISLAAVLSAYNRSEFHHLMPQAFLAKSGADTGSVSVLANFALISAADNKVLGGVAPSVYKSKMPADKVTEILEHAICPEEELFDDDFPAFLQERAARLAARANDLMA